AKMVDVMANIVKFWSLNEQQEKAFRIVANHGTCVAPDQLLMHLGGMGGTGKSRVINALVEFFRARDESYRFVLMAPTGTAAALIGGSTYHSLLGLNKKNSAAAIEELRELLKRTDYALLDECSMVGCFNMTQISARLCEIMGNYEKPFGGVNVIFVGDFAQLPPTGCLALYSRKVTMVQSPKQSLIVILKENMRQKGVSAEDQAFRTALGNLSILPIFVIYRK
ncbi:hypothetical protein EST38_g14627, partial [Candolleomyces aberdarensis]